FRLQRRDLAAGRNGGLAAVSKKDRERDDMLFLGPAGHANEKRTVILTTCAGCHLGGSGGPGILSLNSYTGAFDNVSRLHRLRSLAESSLKGQEDATIAWKRKRFSWGLLTGLRESRSKK